MKINVSAAEIIEARNDATDVWAVGDAVLYRLCREYPHHADVQEVVAKLWLVGRAYSAAIERRPVTQGVVKESMKAYYRRAAEALIASEIDAAIAALPSNPPESLEDVGRTLPIHMHVMGCIKSVSNADQRSFASKYLHFHRPDWFVMFDSVAVRGLCRLLGRAPSRQLRSPLSDAEYTRFVARAWQLRHYLESLSDSSLTLRALDRLLLARGA